MVLALSANVTHIANSTPGSILITVTGGSPPFLVNWSDLTEPKTHSTSTVYRSGITASGEYSVNIYDADGSLVTNTYYVAPSISTTSTDVKIGTLATGYLGYQNPNKCLDLCGNITVFVSRPWSGTAMISKLSHVFVSINSGGVWTTAQSLPSGYDTTLYAYAVSTNGTRIAVLGCSCPTDLSSNAGTSYIKRCYIYTVSGTTITATNNFYIYSTGTTYVYRCGLWMSYRNNTLGICVQSTSTDVATAFMYVDSGGGSFTKTANIVPTTVSTNTLSTRCEVGDDSYFTYTIWNNNSSAGMAELCYYNGTSWQITELLGGASDSLGYFISMYKNTVALTRGSSIVIYKHTPTTGWYYVALFTGVTNTNASICLYKNVLAYGSSLTTISFYVDSGAADASWTSSLYSVTRNNTSSSTENGICFNEYGLVYGDRAYSSTLGRICACAIQTPSAKVSIIPGEITHASSSTASDGSISITGAYGFTSFTYAWSDGSSTASSRTGLAAGTYRITVTSGGVSSYYTYVVVAASVAVTPVTDVLGGSASITLPNSTPPITATWSDVTEPRVHNANCVRRSGLAAGDYEVILRDAVQIKTIHKFTVAPYFASASATTLYDGTVSGGMWGSISNQVKGVDAVGNIIVTTPVMGDGSCTCSTVIVSIKSGGAWTHRNLPTGYDTTHRVYGVATNGTSVAVLTCSYSSGSWTANASTSDVKRVYLYSVSGTTVSTLSNFYVYSTGTTYVYTCGTGISYKNNTIGITCVPASGGVPTVYIYDDSNGTGAFVKTATLTTPTASTGNFASPRFELGDANHGILSSPDHNSWSGLLGLCFRNGSTWTISEIVGSTGYRAGSFTGAYADRVAFYYSSSLRIYKHNGTSWSEEGNIAVSGTADSNGGLFLSRNSVAYHSSVSQISINVLSGSSGSAWTEVAQTFARYTDATTNTGNSVVLTDTDLVYCDHGYNSSTGRFLTCPITVPTTSINVVPGIVRHASSGVSDGSITNTDYYGVTSATYSWSDGSTTTSDRTGLATGTYVVTLTSGAYTSKYTYVVGSITTAVTAITSSAAASITLTLSNVFFPVVATWSDLSKNVYHYTSPIVRGGITAGGDYAVKLIDANGNCFSKKFTLSPYFSGDTTMITGTSANKNIGETQGKGMDLCDGVLVVTTKPYSGATNSLISEVRVCIKSGGSWSASQSLPSGYDDTMRVYGVATNGKRIAVLATYDTSHILTQAGAGYAKRVYIFTVVGTSIVYTSYFNIYSSGITNYSNLAVYLGYRENTIVIGGVPVSAPMSAYTYTDDGNGIFSKSATLSFTTTFNGMYAAWAKMAVGNDNNIIVANYMHTSNSGLIGLFHKTGSTWSVTEVFGTSGSSLGGYMVEARGEVLVYLCDAIYYFKKWNRTAWTTICTISSTPAYAWSGGLWMGKNLFAYRSSSTTVAFYTWEDGYDSPVTYATTTITNYANNPFHHCVYENEWIYSDVGTENAAVGIIKRRTIVTPTSSITAVGGNVVPASSYSSSDGSIGVTDYYGVASVTYTWSGSSVTTSSRTGLAPGSYTVTLTSGALTASKTYTVPYVSSSIVNITETVFGSVTITLGGVTQPLTATWSDGVAGSVSGYVITKTKIGTAGEYSVLVKDASNFSAVLTYEIQSQFQTASTAITGDSTYNYLGNYDSYLWSTSSAFGNVYATYPDNSFGSGYKMDRIRALIKSGASWSSVSPTSVDTSNYIYGVATNGTLLTVITCGSSNQTSNGNSATPKKIHWFDIAGTSITYAGSFDILYSLSTYVYSVSGGIDVKGNTMAIGVVEISTSDRPCVYTYVYGGGAWTKASTLTYSAAPTNTSSFYTNKIAVGNDTVAISSVCDWSTSTATNCGIVSLWHNNGTAWSSTEIFGGAADRIGYFISAYNHHIAYYSLGSNLIKWYKYDGGWNLITSFDAGSIKSNISLGCNNLLTYASSYTNAKLWTKNGVAGTSPSSIDLAIPNSGGTQEYSSIRNLDSDLFVGDPSYPATGPGRICRSPAFVLATPAAPTVGTITIGTASVTVTLGAYEPTVTYYLSYTSTNSSSATMTNCVSLTSQTTSQTVTISNLTAATTIYLWVRHKTSADTYVVLSDSSSCTTPAFTITTTGTVTGASSYTSADGSITATITNATSPTYSWSDGSSTSSSRTSLLPGAYTITITSSLNSISYTYYVRGLTVSLTNISGSTYGAITWTCGGYLSPITVTTDLGTSTVTGTAALTTVSRSLISAPGQYAMSMTDANGITVSDTYRIMGTFPTPSTLYTGAFTGGKLGTIEMYSSSPVDTYGNVMVMIPRYTKTAKMSDVRFAIKTGTTWGSATALPTNHGDTTNYVYGVSTNGSVIVVLVSANAQSQNNSGTSEIKKFYSFTVSGTTVTYQTVTSIYYTGTTYPLIMSAVISFRNNTLAISVANTTNVPVYYVYAYNGSTFTKTFTLTYTTAVSGATWCSNVAVGNDSHLITSVYQAGGSYTEGGTVGLWYYNGSTWGCTQYTGASNYRRLGYRIAARDNTLAYIDRAAGTVNALRDMGSGSWQNHFTVAITADASSTLNELTEFRSVSVWGELAIAFATSATNIQYYYWNALTGWTITNTTIPRTADQGPPILIGNYGEMFVGDPAYSSNVGRINRGGVPVLSFASSPTANGTYYDGANLTVTIQTLGEDATYSYYVSYTTTNSSSATMIDGCSLSSVTTAQTVSFSGLSASTTYYLWVRSKNTSTNAYTVICVNSTSYTTNTYSASPGTITHATTYNGSNGSIAAPTINSMNTSYAWSDGSITTSSRSSLSPGTYTMTATSGSNVFVYAYKVFGVTESVTNFSTGTYGSISLLVGGMTSPFTVTTDISTYTQTGTTFTRSLINTSGEYFISVTDAVGSVLTKSYRMIGTFSSVSTAYTGTLATGRLGNVSIFDKSPGDTYGNVMVWFPNKDFNIIAKMSDVRFAVKTGATWGSATALPTTHGDTTNYVFGVATNGSVIVVLVNSNSAYGGSSSEIKRVYSFTVSGTTVTYQTVLDVYSSGTTYVNYIAAVISFKSNTMALAVGETSDLPVYYLYTYTGSGFTKSNTLTYPTPSSGAILGTVSVGNDSCIVTGSINYSVGYNECGTVGLWYKNGSTWVCTQLFGSSTYARLGYRTAAKDNTVMFTNRGTGYIYGYVCDNGVWSSPFTVVMTANVDAGISFDSEFSSIAVLGSYMYAYATSFTNVRVYYYTLGAWTYFDVAVPHTSDSGSQLIFGNYGEIFVGDPGYSSSLGRLSRSYAPTLALASSPSVSNVAATTASISISITILGTDATYAYYLSYSTTNSSSSTMTDWVSLNAQTTSQTVSLTGLSSGTTYYAWVRMKNTSTNAYTVISDSASVNTISASVPPSGGSILVSNITTTTASSTVSVSTLGTDATYTYHVSSTTTNSYLGTMTDLVLLNAQIASQTASLTNLSPGTTYYVWVRAKNTSTNAYTVISSSATLTTTISPGGGSISVSNITTTTASSTVSITTLGSDATYTYHVSSTTTNSSSGTMTDLVSLNAQTSSQTVSITGLSPGITYYVWARAKNTSTNAYTVISSSATLTTTYQISITPGSVTDVSVRGQSTGAIGATGVSAGTSPYTASWSSTGTSISTTSYGAQSNLAAGSYTVTITDHLGISGSHTYTISQPDLLLTPGTVSNVTTRGVNTGAISATTVDAAHSYSTTWTCSAISGASSTGTVITSQTINAKSNLASATYTITIVDLTTNLTASHSYTITEPSELVVSGTTTPLSGIGTSDGSLVISVSGGVSPYLISWSPSTITSNATSVSNLSEGTYVATVTDSSGYFVSKSLSVTYAVTSFTSLGSGYCCDYDPTSGVTAIGYYTYDSSKGRVYCFSSSLSLVQTLSSPSPTSNYYFGKRLAVEGNKMAVSESGASKVHVYVYSNSTWTLSYSVSASYVPDFVDIVGTRLAVGCPASSKVITYISGTAEGTISSTATNFGSCVSIGSDELAIGTNGNGVLIYGINASAGTSSGLSTTWTVASTSYISGKWGGATAGSFTVPSDSSTTNTFTLSYSGILYVRIDRAYGGIYVKDNVSGASVCTISFSQTTGKKSYSGSATASNLVPGRSYTIAVSIYGCNVVGPFYVSAYMPGTSVPAWTLTSTVKPSGCSSQYGYSSDGRNVLKLSGNTLIVGDPGASAVYVMSRSGSTWSSLCTVKHHASASGFGSFLDYYDNLLVAGCSGSGSVDVWRTSSATSSSYSLANVMEFSGEMRSACVTFQKIVACSAAGACYDSVAIPIFITPGAVTDVLIHGGSTGRIGETVSTKGRGSNSYSWTASGGATDISLDTTSSSKSDLKVGTYSITVIDSVGTTASHEYVVGQPDPLSVTWGAVSNSLSGSANGKITAPSVSGGTGSYSYVYASMSQDSSSVSNPAVKEDKTNLGAGYYSVTVTDSNGAKASSNFLVGEYYEYEIQNLGSSPSEISLWGVILATVDSEGGKIYRYDTGTWSLEFSTSGSFISVAATDVRAFFSEVDSVKVYDYASSSWTLSQTVTGSIGKEISAYGDYMVSCGVGVDFVRFYEIVNGTWSEVAYVASPCDSLDLNGSIAVSGSASEDRVYVFERDSQSETWNQDSILPGGSASRFGASVTVYGSRIAVGAPDQGAGGMVYIYKKTSTWDLITAILPTDVETGASFGSSVKFSNSKLIVGAESWGSGSGCAYLFEIGDSATECYQIAQIRSNNEFMGSSVSVSDNVACVLGNLGVATNAVPTSLTVIPGIAYISGTITAASVSGGSGTYNYYWSTTNGILINTTGASQTKLTGGTYLLEIVDTNGVKAYVSYVIGTVDPIIIVGSASKVDVYGESTGVISTVGVTGGTGNYISTTWHSTDGASTLSSDLNQHSGILAGTYVLTVVDSDGHVGSKTFIVEQNPELAVTPGAITHVVTYGSNTGIIGQTAVSGGYGNYYYNWKSSATQITDSTASAKNGLYAGIYILFINDDVGAQAQCVYEILQNEALTLVPGSVECSSSDYTSDGVIRATGLLGGSGTYSIAWTSSGSGANDVSSITTADAITGLAPGTYSVRVTDSVTEDVVSYSYEIKSLGSITFTSSYFAISASWASVPGASHYVIYYKRAGDSSYSRVKEKTANAYTTIKNVIPGETYSFNIYAYVTSLALSYTGQCTVPTTTVVVSSFSQNSVYDLTNVPPLTVVNVARSSLSHGDKIKVDATFNSSTIVTTATVCSVGNSYTVSKNISICVPFDSANASKQDAFIVDSKGVSTTVEYNNGTITFGGVVYNPGDTFYFDGQKVEVVSLL